MQTLDVLTRIIGNDFDRLVTDMTRSVRHLEDVEQRVQSRLRLLHRALA